jgi:beta-aspartyl-peptidase (threonine type)
MTRVALSGQIAIALHGGAGTIRRADMTPELDSQYRQALSEALQKGYAVLQAGGTSLDAVEAAILVLEDCPLFNAGRGAALTRQGVAEMDASVMEGRSLRAGAVGAVTRIRNPIKAARAVMEKTPHLLLIGEGAHQLAREAGLELVDNSWFITDRRQKALEEAQRREKEFGHEILGVGEWPAEAVAGSFFDPEIEGKFGTVGCVALDRRGDLVAGTSTGGMTNKRFGRVGDTPIIGAGNYAENATCAVSTTGQGEFFMRLLTAADMAARMRYLNQPLAEAATAQVKRLNHLKGLGGLVALDAGGQVSFVFNTEGMYRGVIDAAGQPQVAIYGDERIPGDDRRNGGLAWDV